MTRGMLRATVALTFALSFAGCSGAPASRASYPCNDAEFVSLQNGFASGARHRDYREVDICGPVTSVLAARHTRSGEHGYYRVRVAPGDSVEIVCNLNEMYAPAWPWVKVGAYSYVQGRFYYDSPSSQGIDWTHRGSSRSWPTPGYVVIDGTLYQ